jgi:hypothetical protein
MQKKRSGTIASRPGNRSHSMATAALTQSARTQTARASGGPLEEVREEPHSEVTRVRPAAKGYANDVREEDLDRLLELFESRGLDDEDDRPAAVPGGGIAEALRFLQMLIEGNHLVLTSADAPAKLAPRLAEILGADEGAATKAAHLSGWLCDEDTVVDLFLDDDALEQLLAVW